MSYFAPNGVVYIIVPTLEVTTEMENNMKVNFNSDLSTLRKSTDIPEKTLFKVRNPVSAAFNGYTWHNQATIATELAKPEWN